MLSFTLVIRLYTHGIRLGYLWHLFQYLEYEIFFECFLASNLSNYLSAINYEFHMIFKGDLIRTLGLPHMDHS